ncbi:PIN domain-containing protein [Meiothermus cerbereus]|uniref:PIN domain-containing protein n=1 Tax=Meiothermus cerbereus TaxID=65552 RepID=UPI00047F9452|nr:PIN domain-containing protein [Meiothermus cerbereus]
MARILVDTSAWIEFYHPKGARQVKQALGNALEVHEIAVLAPIAVELLSGAKSEKDYGLLAADLQALLWLPLGSEEAGVAGQLAYDLARSGQRVPTVDLLIAGAALVHGCELWHFGDAHFATIKGHSPLQEHNLKSA